MGALNHFICDRLSAPGSEWGNGKAVGVGSYRSGAVPPQLPNKMSRTSCRKVPSLQHVAPLGTIALLQGRHEFTPDRKQPALAGSVSRSLCSTSPKKAPCATGRRHKGEGFHPPEFSLKSATKCYAPGGPDLRIYLIVKMYYLCKLGNVKSLGNPGHLLKCFYILYDQMNSFFFFDKYINLLWVHKLIAYVSTKAFS